MKISDEMVVQVAEWLWRAHEMIEHGSWKKEKWENLDAEKRDRWVSQVRIQITNAVAPMILEEAAKVAEDSVTYEGVGIAATIRALKE